MRVTDRRIGDMGTKEISLAIQSSSTGRSNESGARLYGVRCSIRDGGSRRWWISSMMIVGQDMEAESFVCFGFLVKLSFSGLTMILNGDRGVPCARRSE